MPSPQLIAALLAVVGVLLLAGPALYRFAAARLGRVTPTPANVADDVTANALALHRLAQLAEARHSDAGRAACDTLAPLVFSAPSPTTQAKAAPRIEGRGL